MTRPQIYNFAKRVSYCAAVGYIVLCIFYSVMGVQPLFESFIRITGCLVFCLAYWILTDIVRIPSGIMGWLGPLLFFANLTVTAAVMEGDPLYFYLLMVTAFVAFCYLDISALIKYIISTLILLFPLVILFRSFILGPAYPRFLEYERIAIYALLSVLLGLCSHYFLPAFEQAEKSGSTFDAIMSTTSSYMVIIGDNAEVEYVSDSLAEWLGLRREYIRNRPLLDIITMGSMQMMFQEVMERGGYVKKNFEIEIKDQNFFFLLRSSPLGRENSIARLFEWTDITPVMNAKTAAESAVQAKVLFLSI